LNLRNKLVLPVLVAALVVPLFAAMSNAASWFSRNSSVKSTTVNLAYNSKLANGSTLEAGNYKLEIPLHSKSLELKFYQNGKLVASVPAQIKKETLKPTATQIDYTRKGNDEYITEIHLDGMRKAYVISSSKTMKSGA
jgi:hypothetical protein